MDNNIDLKDAIMTENDNNSKNDTFNFYKNLKKKNKLKNKYIEGLRNKGLVLEHLACYTYIGSFDYRVRGVISGDEYSDDDCDTVGFDYDEDVNKYYTIDADTKLDEHLKIIDFNHNPFDYKTTECVCKHYIVQNCVLVRKDLIFSNYDYSEEKTLYDKNNKGINDLFSFPKLSKSTNAPPFLIIGNHCVKLLLPPGAKKGKHCIRCHEKHNNRLNYCSKCNPQCSSCKRRYINKSNNKKRCNKCYIHSKDSYKNSDYCFNCKECNSEIGKVRCNECEKVYGDCIKCPNEYERYSGDGGYCNSCKMKYICKCGKQKNPRFSECFTCAYNPSSSDESDSEDIIDKKYICECGKRKRHIFPTCYEYANKQYIVIHYLNLTIILIV